MAISQPRGLPKWVEVRDVLLERVTGGTWPTGFRVPPEPELAESLGVSRATLREALRSLQEEGVLSRRPGAGTFVTFRPRLTENLGENFGVSDMIRAMGMEAGTRALRLYETEADEQEAAGLGLEAGTPLAVVERIRTADGRPVVLSSDYYPATALQASMGSPERLGGESLYDFFERHLGIVIEHGVATLAPAVAGERVAEALEVAPGTLLLSITQIDYAADGTAVLLSKEHHLADAFEFTVVRRGSRPSKDAHA